jgi:competence protein ComEC
MKKIIILILALFLAFGCLGAETKPANTSRGEQKPITININNQTNQPTITNETAPTEPIDPVENPINNSVDPRYVEEPSVPFAIYFIDASDSTTHANAVLVKKGDFDLLIDAASEGRSGKVIDFLRSKNVDDIEVLVSTNADPRNYGGISRVLDTYEIENFWVGEESSNNDYSRIVDKAENEARKSYRVYRGFEKEYNGIKFEVLNPDKDRPFGDVNNEGVIIKVTNGNFSALLLGSAQTGVQGRLLNEEEGKVVDIPVIQAPYYGVGAGTSNIGIYLNKAKPKDVIISGSGTENAVMGGSRDPFRRLLNQYHIQYYETYRNGSIKVISNGLDYAVERDG